MFVVLVTYLICLSGRGLVAVVTGYGIQVFLALLTEAVAAPMGAITDAAVMAAATDEVRWAGDVSEVWGGYVDVVRMFGSGTGVAMNLGLLSSGYKDQKHNIVS